MLRSIKRIHDITINILIMESNKISLISLKKLLIFIKMNHLLEDYSLFRNYILVIMKKNNFLYKKSLISSREYQENNLVLLKSISLSNSWLQRSKKNELILILLDESSKVKLRRNTPIPDYFSEVNIESFLQRLDPKMLFNQEQLNQLFTYGCDF